MSTYRIWGVVAAIPLALAQVEGAAAAERMDQEKAGIILKDDRVPAGTARASKLIGTEVYDPQGTDVAKVKDIVLSPGHQHVSYIVLSQPTGWLGTQEKLIALPYKAMNYGSPAEDRVYVVLNRSVLEQAPGFEGAEWPIQVNADYYRSLDTYYGTEVASLMEEADSVSLEDTAQPAGAQIGEPQELPWHRRSTKLIDRVVISPTGEKLGEISDIVLEQKSGTVSYAVLKDYRGKLHAVSIDALMVQPGDDKKLVLNSSREQLRTTPSFDEKHWPTQPDPRWTSQTGAQQSMAR